MQLQRPFAVVTPTVDGDVLSVLATVDQWFSAPELARVLPQRSRTGIRLALKRLSEQGVVDVEELPRNLRYRLNQEHLAAQPIIALARQRASLVYRLETELTQWGDLTPVWSAIFGSAVRGEMRADSDIDLFLVIPDHLADAGYARLSELTHSLASRVHRWTGNDAQILEMTVEQVRRGPSAEPVLYDIDNHGVRVTGEADWLRRIVAGGARPAT